MCTRPRRSGIAVILAWIVLFWRIRCCQCGIPYVTPCNVVADGRELLCRGADLLSLEPIFDVDPLKAIVPVNITKIDLTNNNITDIPIRAFHRFPNLEILFLRRNHIRAIHDDAFINLSNLRILELDENYLTKIPTAAVNLPSLEELSISNNKIEHLTRDALRPASNLMSLDLRGNPIKEVHNETFQNLGKLRKLILSNVKELRLFPNLNGAVSLEVLRLDRSQLKEVTLNLCRQCPKLKSLDMKSNSLTEIPNLRSCNELRVLDLASNMISMLPDDAFKGLNMLHDLLLSNNNLQSISSNAFTGLSRLQVLDLENNYIEYIHPDAFRETKRLQDLNLGNNVFPTLPIRGLAGLLHLKTFNNPALREFPSPERFPRVQTMLLSYAYHCCSFLSLEVEESVTKSPVQESILFPTDDFDNSLWNSTFSDIWPQLGK